MSETNPPRVTAAQRLGAVLQAICLGLIPVLAVAWVMDVPLMLNVGLILDQFVLTICGLAVAAAFLSMPYGPRLGWLDIGLAMLGLACWLWSAINYTDWLLDLGNRGPHKWLPGAIGLVLLMEGVRRHCGLAIAVLMGLIGVYGFVGHFLPGLFEAAYTEPRRLVLYLYADSNGVSGQVLSVAATVVLAFILFSKTLEVGGAGKFFDDVATAMLGHYRGGPAKVAVVSSALFGIISGSSVANVVSSGIVTIPLMKRNGYPGPYAAAVEAVSSNAGQVTPPVMGATAFLIAEFLQIPYSEVVLAATVPALIFYFALFVQIDAYAARHGLKGLPPAQLPRLGETLRQGWIYVLPIGLLVYLMFWGAYDAAKAALVAALAMLALSLLRRRRRLDLSLLRALTVDVGKDMLVILLVSGAAGIVVGVLNISGLSFAVTLFLTHLAESAGVLAMLLMTAVIAVVLGMGMPTAAVYVLLSVVLGPSLVKNGLDPLAAHMFIFYFGILSMLTPPVAMASYAAASLAGADLWRTSILGLRMGASGYLMPFIFALNPGLLLRADAPLANLLTLLSVAWSAALLGFAAEGVVGTRPIGRMACLSLLASGVAVGSATLWLPPQSPWVLAVIAASVGVLAIARALAGRPFSRLQAEAAERRPAR